MDRLEAVEIRFGAVIKNKDFRFDSGFWTTVLMKNNQIKYDKIGNILLKSQYGISVAMNEDNIGFPIYRMNEISNMLCDLNVSKCADISENELEIFKLNDGDVLFNRTNSYEWVGRTGIYYKNNMHDLIFASYLVRFVPDPQIIAPEYLSSFLNTLYGIRAIKARARQSINQTNVNPEEVKEIEIPLLGSEIQKNISYSFKKANKLRILSENFYTESQNLLLSELGLLNYTTTNKAVSIKSLSNSFGASGRLDAEYYQPKYEEISKALSNYKYGSKSIKESCNLYDANFKPDLKLKYKYIELSNINNLGEINNVEIQIGEELPSRARRKVETGHLLVSSIEGSLSSCAMVTKSYNNALCSTGFYVINSDSVNSETMLVFLKSDIAQNMLKQQCSGTILTSINKDDFLSILIPQIDMDIQNKIKERITKMYKAKSQSTILLENAKFAVEMAIEQGENVAIKWLEGLI